LAHFRGSELQNYFTKILEDNLKAIIKPQYVDHIPKAVKGIVGEIMKNKNERKVADEVIADLGAYPTRPIVCFFFFFLGAHLYPFSSQIWLKSKDVMWATFPEGSSSALPLP